MKKKKTTLPPVARQWIAALRSGKYQQASSLHALLRENDGHTPLGVLCELAVEAKVITSYNPAQCIPRAVQKWAGMNQFPVGVNFDEGTFAQIATHLKTDWRGIFAPIGTAPKSGKLVSLTKRKGNVARPMAQRRDRQVVLSRAAPQCPGHGLAWRVGYGCHRGTLAGDQRQRGNYMRRIAAIQRFPNSNPGLFGRPERL